MKIKASELSEDARKTHLIEASETLTVTEIERDSGTNLRRFELYNQSGLSVGVFYEDQVPERVLQQESDGA